MHWTQEAHTKSGILVYKLRIKRQNVPIIYLYLTSKYTPPHEFQNSDLGPVVYCF